jgi:hypothetical protein
MSEIKYIDFNKLSNAPPYCWDCDLFWGIYENDKSPINWRCKKGVEFNPPEKPPCEED